MRTPAPPAGVRALLSLAERRLPPQHRARYQQEWLAEVHDLPATGQLGYAARVLGRAGSLRAALADASASPLGGDAAGLARGSRVLVVANETLDSPELLRAVQDRMATGPCHFTLIVPATARPVSRTQRVAQGLQYSEGGFLVQNKRSPQEEAWSAAEGRLEAALMRLRGMGARASGTVGNPDPVRAITDALARGDADEILVSTLPSGLSTWLRVDPPSRIQRTLGRTVTVVTVRH